MPCTACCQGWLSAEIRGHKVFPGAPCPFSKPQGCSIYSERPTDPCRNFVCSWLVDNSPLPEWMRPDRCGAIVLLSVPWHGRLVIRATPVGRVIPPETLEWLKQYAQRTWRPLVFAERIKTGDAYSARKLFGFGPPEFKYLVAKVAASEPEASMELHATDITDSDGNQGKSE